MQERQFIESLYEEKAKNDSNSQDLANSLNILSKTVFGDVNRFVFELLQNADDSPNIPGRADVDVEFRLLDNYLIFKHSGAHFTENDVTGISRVGSRESQKDKDIQKIGYKGIGFKSVFGSSDKVHIISNKFSFRFDKDHEMWKGKKGYPWQVIPIWTEEAPLEIKDYVDNSMVNTIISVSNKTKIKQEILNIFNDCQIVLFLRNIRSVSVYVDNSCLLKIEKRESDGGVRELIKNGKVESSWIIKDFILSIDETLRTKLRVLSDEECPQKLKEAEGAKITLAAYVKDNRIMIVNDALMYCYLPTKVKKGFPFIINADFITNAERTQFLTNEWNVFLFKQIALKLFEWISELQATKLKYQFPALIKNKFGGIQLSEIEKSYNSGFDLALQTIPFIPQLDGNQLMKIEESIIDDTKFSSAFNPALVTNYLRSTKRIADSNIEYSYILAEIGCEVFDIKALSNFFNENKFKAGKEILFKEIIKLIQFFKNKMNNNKDLEWGTLLKDTKFLIDQDGIFGTPKEIYFPLSKKEKEVSEFLELRLLNENIYSHFSNDSSTIKWLNDLGLKEPSELEIVRKSISRMIEENRISELNALQVGRFVFNVYNSGEFSDKDYDILRKLKLSTPNGLRMPSDCYLPSNFEPELKIDSVLPSANFVSNLYCESDTELLNWKLFLLRIGVKDKISIVTNPARLERTKLISKYPQYESYFEWLDTKEHYPALYRPWKGSGQHGVINFSFVDFLEQTHIYSFSKAFWKIIFDNWSEFFSKCHAIDYYYYGGSSMVPSYVKFYSQNNPAIPATDGKCYGGLAVYAPNLKTLIGDHFPVADFDSRISREQIEFFGLKVHVSFIHCFEILANLESQEIDSQLIKQMYAIYEQMIKTKSDVSTKDIQDIRTWRKCGKLLALNNTFQKVETLFCFSVNGFNPPASSEYFIKLPHDMKQQEVESFCSLFEIPLVSFDQLEFVPQNIALETGLLASLNAKAKYFSIIYSHMCSEDINAVHERLLEKINSTVFYVTESLSLVYKTGGGDVIFNSNIETWFDQEGSFYYVGNWNSPLTLYSLSSSLCDFLGLKKLERELALILQLNEDEIKGWLKEKGYDIPEMKVNTSQIHNAKVEEATIVYGTQTSMVSSEAFEPKISASDIDVSNVTAKKKSAEAITLSVKDESNQIVDSQVRLNIGKWGEEFVLNYLKSHNEIYEDVIWNNEQGESNMPYDFEVLENGIQKFIEVKGTPSSDKNEIYLSVNEWVTMFQKADQYSIYRVYNVGSADAVLEILDNPADLVKRGIIIPNPITLWI